jgi:glycosyltransferase involved in cell wall biosynthesis
MKVSIIITCYDRQMFVSRAIRCAISQRFPREDFEVVVVDDASRDHSREIIEDFGEDIVPIFLEKNAGLAAARNIGIRKARGRFVLHLDSDDYMHDELLHFAYAHLMMNPEWGAAACDYYLVDTSERHLERCSAAQKPIACGVLFRKDLLVQIGLYDPELRACEDEDLRERFSREYLIGHVALPLYRYTRHEGNLTNDGRLLERYRRRIAKKNGATPRPRARRAARGRGRGR